MPKRIAVLFERWALKHLPASIIARPGEWFIAMILGLSGIAIITRTSRPQAPQRILPQWAYNTWAAVLIVGCLMLICGLTSIHWVKAPVLYEMVRTACFKFGLRLLGIGASTYAVAALLYAGWNGLFAFCLAAMFSGFCFIRLLTTGVRL